MFFLRGQGPLDSQRRANEIIKDKIKAYSRVCVFVKSDLVVVAVVVAVGVGSIRSLIVIITTTPTMRISTTAAEITPSIP